MAKSYDMNKNILIITIIALVVIAAAVFVFVNRGPSYQKESLTIERDLTPIELSQEEKQALQDAGLAAPAGEDAAAKKLQSVRSSNELGAIEADLNETNLSGLDAELESIESDLSSL